MEFFLEILKNLTFLDLALICFAAFFISFFSRGWRTYRKAKKQYDKEMAELEANKCKGAHKWFTMPVLGEKTHVCKLCYWCPKHTSFIKKYFVKAELETIKFKEEMAKYEDEKTKELAEELGISSESVRDIYKKVADIKKQFTLQYIEKKNKKNKESDV